MNAEDPNRARLGWKATDAERGAVPDAAARYRPSEFKLALNFKVE